MVNIISFSLWGQDPKYCIGAIRNAELAEQYYPDWQCVFQLDATVPNIIEDALAGFDHATVVRRLDLETNGIAKGDWRGMFWRFEYVNTPDVDAMISRDCDSRLSAREATAVQRWLDSGKGFHIMRDHPWHGSKMLGGMWGCRSGALPEFNELMARWNQEDRWQTDQDFLNTEIYPRIVNDSMIHASFFKIEPHAEDFPMPRRGTEFVGQVFDENEVTVAEHVSALAKAL